MRSRLSAALLLVLLLLLLPVLVAETPRPIYRAGDYFVYRVIYRISNQTSTICAIDSSLLLVVRVVEYPYVYFDVIVKEVEASGDCPLFRPLFREDLLREGVRETVVERIDEKPRGAVLRFFVDPSYSGTYTYSEALSEGNVTLRAIYERGVLISAVLEMRGPGWEVYTSFELVKTTVPGLLTPLWIRVLLIAVIVTVGAVVSVVIITKGSASPLQSATQPPTTVQPHH